MYFDLVVTVIILAVFDIIYDSLAVNLPSMASIITIQFITLFIYAIIAESLS
jgi:hypothetical protein